jgi:hypothetical protein
VQLVERLTRTAVDPGNPRSVSSRARARRWAEFAARFPRLADMRVLDLGGTPGYWRGAPVRPATVTVVNLDPVQLAPRPGEPIAVVQGDACDLPDSVRAERFDLVVSNSVLEHVGGHARREQFAESVHAAAPHHWIQTPYRYFPIEPHWLFPGFQFLPVAAQTYVTRRWPLGHRHATDKATATTWALEAELVSITEMRYYFPGSKIWCERLAGLPKSLVAVR